MACKNVCRLCNRLAISTAVTLDGTDLIVTIPQATYRDGEKVCIVIAQAIPAATPITAPVLIQIGAGTKQYPLTTRCCQQVTACGVRTRTKYATNVVTNSTGAVFRMIGAPACSPDNSLESIDGNAPVTP